MLPQHRFMIDLAGLVVTALILVIAVIFIPVISGRAVLGVLALTSMAIAWALSLSDSLFPSDWLGFGCAGFIFLAALFLFCSVVLVVLP